MMVLLPFLLFQASATTLSLLASYWPVLLGAAAVVSALAKFYLDLLDIRKKHAEVAKLLADMRAQQALIHRPTPDEIDRYGSLTRVVPTRPSLTPLVLAIVCIGLGFVALVFQDRAREFAAASSQQEHYAGQVHALENRNLELGFKIEQLGKELEMLRQRNKELEAELVATERPQRELAEENIALRKQITVVVDRLNKITQELNQLRQ